MLSVIIPTKNEAANIEACVRAFVAARNRGKVEILVVDNASTDDTRKLALQAGAQVCEFGPERSAQRNCGWQLALGDYVMFVDADMIVPEATLTEILALISRKRAPDALYVREVRSGRGLRIKARNFERSFYDATEIDGLRVVRKSLLAAVGGYDPELTACEDWDLDRRLLAHGASTALTQHALIHNERNITFSKHLGKKRYYAETMDRYRAKWHNDATVRRQFSPGYRLFGIFFRNGNWKRTLRHPLLYAITLCDRLAVGFIYLFRRHA